jgi:hypothetical protein
MKNELWMGQRHFWTEALFQRSVKETKSGKPKMGKGLKVMEIANGNVLPIGIYVTSSNSHEIKLVQPTLESSFFGNRWRMISGVRKQQE